MLPDQICYSPDGVGGGAHKEATPFNELPIPIQAATKELFDYAPFAPPARTDPAQGVSNYARYRT